MIDVIPRCIMLIVRSGSARRYESRKGLIGLYAVFLMSNLLTSRCNPMVEVRGAFDEKLSNNEAIPKVSVNR